MISRLMSRIREFVLSRDSSRFSLETTEGSRNLICSVLNTISDKIEEGQALIPVPGFLGSFYMDIRSHIFQTLIIENSYEPNLINVVKENIDPEKDVIDVGANVGLFTVLFSKLISGNKKVLSIEPTPSAGRYLHLNVEKNSPADTVIIFEGIATDRKGKYQINTIPGKEEYSSVGISVSHPAVKNYKYERLNVEGDSIDNLVSENQLSPGFIKIDVEGAENSVLEGAKATLVKYKPVVIAELYDTLLSNCGSTSAKVVSLLESCGYTVLDLKSRKRPSYPFGGDVLAVPKS